MADLPEPGDLFEGKYLIEDEIGSGGFAAVYRAVDQATERVVAIKILVPLEHETDYSERLTARFEREARLLAGLRSQHTVTLFEFGRSVDGLLYLVFEFVDGTTLRDLVRLKGPQAPERVVTILRQVCTALHEAHQSGVLHRDIKPANIMVHDHLEMRDVVKLLDFGIAKPIAGNSEVDDETITTFGSVLGTPRYMSPEQLAHQELSPASDIYSLGLVAFELLTGTRAIDEESPTGILRAQLSTEPIEFDRDSAVPRGLRHTVEKMLAKKRDARYQDLAAVVRDLEDWDDDDMPAGVVRLAVVGLVLGVALLAAALVIGDQPRKAVAVSVERDPVTFGEPAWVVPLDTAGLTFTWISSTTDYELAGGSDPRGIPPVTRGAVAVERDGVAVEPGVRWVGSLIDWDGRKLQHEIVLRRVDEPRFRAMGEAQMAAIRLARPFISTVYTQALGRALELGHDVAITKVGWEKWIEDVKGSPPPTDGLILQQESSDLPFIFARAKTIRANGARNWRGVLEACGPLAGTNRFCARHVARAHLKRGELDEACYWYERIEEVPAGTTCLSSGTRPLYTDLPPER